MTKIKIYDFDKTLVDTDSIRVLIRFALKNGYINIFELLWWFIRGFFLMLFTFKFENFKSTFVKVVEAVPEEALKQFSKEFIKNHGYKNLIREIHEDGYTTILCSASLYGYMKYVKEILGVDYLIATSHSGGKVIGKNNTKMIKKENLEKLFKNEGIVVLYDESKSYTDSYDNDFWMCGFTKNKYIVNSKKTYPDFINIDGIN